MHRNKISWATVLFATLAVILGFSTFRGYTLSTRYKRELENSYRHSLEELAEYTSNIENTLQKGLYVNTAKQQHNIAAELMTESNGAISAMARLPLADVDLENVNKFISQVGDFALYISSQISAGRTLSESEIKSLHELSSYARQVNESIKNVLFHFQNGYNSIVEMSEHINNNSGDEPNVNTGFKELNEIFVDYPTLIYDGPFSDHITRMEPKLLKDAENLSEEQQKEVAAKFLDVDKDELKKIGESGGTMPITKFSLNDQTEISVTQKGGYVDYVVNSGYAMSSNLSSTDAINIAKYFLEKQGYHQMKESYFSSVNGICTINFAYVEDGITFYSDLIKVGISLEDGKIMLFEATGYIMNHSEREIPTDILTKEEAQRSLNNTLRVEEQSTAFSPTSGLNEVLCYEFKCYSTETNEQLLIYVNAQTGYEEKIFILRNSENSRVVV